MAARPPAGFEEFVGFARRGLLRFGYQLTGSRSEAEDLVQQALVKAWQHWARVEQTDYPVAYVKRTMVNLHVSLWRRQARHEVLAAGASSPSEVSHEDLTVERRCLIESLATLTRHQRAVIVLRYFEDMTEAQAAEVLHCSVGTIKSQAARAMKVLRRTVGQATDTSTTQVSHHPPDWTSTHER